MGTATQDWSAHESAGPSRRGRAAATRLRIVEAAYAAFLTDGYASTTMAAVARASGVAVQTVYFVFGTKSDLLQAVYEYAVHGPERIPPHRTRWWQAAEREPDIVRAVADVVGGNVDVLERSAPLVHAVLGDEAARDRYEFNEGLRRTGNEVLVGMLAAKHPLRPGLSGAKALDLFLVLTGPQVYTQLTREMSWSPDEVADWVTHAILHHLFGVESENSAG